MSHYPQEEVGIKHRKARRDPNVPLIYKYLSSPFPPLLNNICLLQLIKANSLLLFLSTRSLRVVISGLRASLGLPPITLPLQIAQLQCSSTEQSGLCHWGLVLIMARRLQEFVYMAGTSSSWAANQPFPRVSAL